MNLCSATTTKSFADESFIKSIAIRVFNALYTKSFYFYTRA
jgi:hypothetical protein